MLFWLFFKIFCGEDIVIFVSLFLLKFLFIDIFVVLFVFFSFLRVSFCDGINEFRLVLVLLLCSVLFYMIKVKGFFMYVLCEVCIFVLSVISKLSVLLLFRLFRGLGISL